MRFTSVIVLAVYLATGAAPLVALRAAEPVFDDGFSARESKWLPSDVPGQWTIEGGALRTVGDADDARRYAQIEPVQDVLVQTDIRVPSGGRQVLGVVLRGQRDTYLMVRYDDQSGALEALTLHAGEQARQGERSAKIVFEREKPHHLKAAAVGRRVLAKLWPAGGKEPDWQLDVPLNSQQIGRVGVFVSSKTPAEFSRFRAWNGGAEIEAIRAEAEAQRTREAAQFGDHLQLAVVPAGRPIERDGHKLRPIHVVTYAHSDRRPVGGRLTWQIGDAESAVDLSARDFDQDEYLFFAPEPAAVAKLSVTYETKVGKTLQAAITLHPSRRLPWREYVKTCLDTLIAHGRDVYGDAKTPLFMAVLDVDTLRSPASPPRLDALVRLDGRLHRRGERGSNLWYDQALLLAMYRMTELTGEDKYAQAADAYIGHFFDHCVKDLEPDHVYRNGMPAWGTHVFWDCYRERPGGDGDGNGPHEILVYRPTWENMYRVWLVAINLQQIVLT